jgi:serine/threonine protein kinase
MERMVKLMDVTLGIGWTEREMEELAAFLRPALCVDPNERATAKELLEHPWLNETNNVER